jgi:hypothetical protein
MNVPGSKGDQENRMCKSQDAGGRLVVRLVASYIEVRISQHEMAYIRVEAVNRAVMFHTRPIDMGHLNTHLTTAFPSIHWLMRPRHGL